MSAPFDFPSHLEGVIKLSSNYGPQTALLCGRTFLLDVETVGGLETSSKWPRSQEQQRLFGRGSKADQMIRSRGEVRLRDQEEDMIGQLTKATNDTNLVGLW